MILKVIDFIKESKNIYLKSPSFKALIENRKRQREDQEALDGRALAYEKRCLFIAANHFGAELRDGVLVITGKGLEFIRFN